MKKILVLCPAEVGGEIAAGYLNFFAGRTAAIYRTADKQVALHPVAVEVMQEDNIDITDLGHQSIRELARQRFDFLITLGQLAPASLPRKPKAAEHIHWTIPPVFPSADEPEEQREALRTVRETIKKNVLKFIGQQLLEPAILRT